MSLKAWLMREWLRFTVKRRFQKNADIFALRELLKEAEGNHVESDHFDAVSIQLIKLGNCAAEHIVPLSALNTQTVILYIHGGAWVFGKSKDYRALTTRLVEQTHFQLYALDYRLAPEHPFPAALDDCEAAYNALIKRSFKPNQIIVMGDSAGGNLTFALAMRLKRKKLDLPKALIGLSPCLDLTASGNSFHKNAKADAILPIERLQDCIDAYCPNSDLKEPEVSPLFGDVKGLSPVLLQVSDNEVLLDDSVRFAQKIQAVNGSVEIQIWRGLWHVFQAFPDQIVEARQAIGQVVQFIKKN